MSKFILAKFKSDWADEFDVHGFKVMTEEQYKVWLKELNAVRWPQEMYFGTNEAFEFNSLDEYQECIEIQLIDENEYIALKKLFDTKYNNEVDFTWGNFIDPSEYYEFDEDDDF